MLMEQKLKDDLVRAVERFSDITGVGTSTITREAIRDGSFLPRLQGRNLSVTKYDQVMCWLSDHWPKGKAWPAGIERPAPTKRRAA